MLGILPHRSTNLIARHVICLPDVDVQSEDTEFPQIIGQVAQIEAEYPSDIESHGKSRTDKDCNPDSGVLVHRKVGNLLGKHTGGADLVFDLKTRSDN